MINLENFIRKWTGRRAGFNWGYAGQCTQIVKYWAAENGWAIPNSGGTNRAEDYKNFRRGYIFIENCLKCIPSQGDIVVFGKKVGPSGHVAIAVHGDSMNLSTFGQNWAGSRGKCNMEWHKFYYGCLGWLHWQNKV